MLKIKLSFLYLFSIATTFNLLVAQEEIRVEFDSKPIVMDSLRRGIAPVYRYISDTINYRGHEGVLSIPDSFEAQDTGYFYGFFTGCANPHFDRISVVLVENYKSAKPRFWIDQNGNLDFSDDGRPIETALDGSAVLSFQNSSNSDASFSVKFFQPERDTGEIAMFEKFFGKPGLINGQYLEKVDYWFSDQRMNTKEFIGEIDGKRVKLGLHDYNCDGLYSRNGEDRLLINEDYNQKLSTRVIDGATKLSDTSIMVMGEQAYEIVDIEEAGRSVVLRKTTLPAVLPIKIGSTLPNYKFMIGEKEFRLDDLMEGKDYLFIDIWGAWCKGCVSQIPSVKSFEEEHANRISVLGLNYGDSKESKEAFIEKFALEWPNGDLTEEMRSGLNIEGYPTYLLIDSDRKLVMYESGVYEIGEYLEEE